MRPFPTFLILVFLLIQFTSCDRDEDNKPDPVPEWERFQVFPHANLSEVEFYSKDFGVACGCCGAIFVTENGGLDWESHKKGEFCLRSVFILNENTFFTGSDCVYKFSNGGSSFSILGSGTLKSTITGIHFFDSNNGLVAVGSSIFKTADGGKNWDQVSDLRSAIYLQFISDSIGYAYGGFTLEGIFYGELYKTENQGNNWINLSNTSEVADWEILAMYFLNKDTGYIANYNHEVYYTWNGGITWTMRSDSLPTNIYDMVFVSENEGYGVGFPDLGILKTTDGGITWSWDYKVGTTYFGSIAKTPDNKKVIAVGSNSVIVIKKL
jgi:photosystem II stability/assembly factor-like uncharacterized protein